jgi:hypothetical protein
LLDGVDVAPARVLDPPRAPDIAVERERDLAVHRPLDRLLVGVRELEAVGAEQLDPVVVVRVVAGGDHHPEVGAHFPREQRYRRSRQWSGHDHVHADAGEPGGERGLHHIARQASVLADDDAVLVGAAQEMASGRLADLHRRRRGKRARVGAPANPVGAEIFACIEVFRVRSGRLP